jgi:hypothetical protein
MQIDNPCHSRQLLQLFDGGDVDYLDGVDEISYDGRYGYLFVILASPEWDRCAPISIS